MRRWARCRARSPRSRRRPRVRRAEIVAARKAVREAIDALGGRQEEPTVPGHDDEQSRAKSERMREVSDKQRELGQQQATLGAKQAELGRLQAELGAKQRAAAEAARKRVLAILEEARGKGQVEPVK